MIEKVNPCHPDKVADRIAGAIVDLAYANSANPRCAVEVLIGHGVCHIVAETSERDVIALGVNDIVKRIAGEDMMVDAQIVPQDVHLADNQRGYPRCGDNGIFKGVPLTDEEKTASRLAREIFAKYGTDGKYIVDGGKVIICQSHATEDEIRESYPRAIINPLGYWEGGTDVDTGATNRKLGSDMGHSVTGGGLHGKDLSKADVSVNIYAFLKAQETGAVQEISCAIGDTEIDGYPYDTIVAMAGEYINRLGGFEKFAEWGLF